MKLRQLLNDDDAVSPVIGVILMVAITVILAAVIATFVLGLGEQVSQTSPNASFTFDYDESSPSQDSFTSTFSGSPDGILTVTHAGGPNIAAEQLFISGSSESNTNGEWAADTENDPQYSPGNEISAGNSVEVAVNSGDTVSVTWENEEGSESSTLQRYDVP